VKQSPLLSYWAKLYNGTEAELCLEPAVASLGVPYRFQHPVWGLGVFPDFVLLQDRVVLEVDDPGHNLKRKRDADALRTKKLLGAGWRVARCTNAEALRDPYATVDRMMADLGLTYRTKE
jgi:very-short-patch-repair endonuclease